jgi:hypothetical protein
MRWAGGECKNGQKWFINAVILGKRAVGERHFPRRIMPITPSLSLITWSPSKQKRRLGSKTVQPNPHRRKNFFFYRKARRPNCYYVLILRLTNAPSNGMVMVGHLSVPALSGTLAYYWVLQFESGPHPALHSYLYCWWVIWMGNTGPKVVKPNVKLLSCE